MADIRREDLRVLGGVGCGRGCTHGSHSVSDAEFDALARVWLQERLGVDAAGVTAMASARALLALLEGES